MACLALKISIFVISSSILCVSGDVQVIGRLMTDNISDAGAAIYGGRQWNVLGDPPKQGVLSVEGSSSVTATMNDSCLGTFDCEVGVQFWMRRGGFISDILEDKSEYHQTLSQSLANATPPDVRWINCFRAKDDGWDMTVFHSRCDNKGPTVSLFKVRDDAIFGGFTSTSWGGGATHADKAFLFSLKNDDGQKVLPLITKAKAVNSDPTKGPTFGQGDLTISNNPNMESSSSSAPGLSYRLPAGIATGSAKANNLLAGSATFGLTDMEVFYMGCSSALGMDSGHIPNSSITTSPEQSDITKARLKNNGGVPLSGNPGGYLQIVLNATLLITGFALRATTCSQLELLYFENTVYKPYQESNDIKKFAPPVDGQVTRYVLKSAITTTKVQFKTSSASCKIAVELYGCPTQCNLPLGLESGAIKDDQITASGEKSRERAIDVRANRYSGTGDGCWISGSDSHITINLRTVTTITAIGLQKCYKDDKFPDEYFYLNYAGEDGIFHDYKGNGPTLKKFKTKRSGAHIHMFDIFPPIVAHKIQVKANKNEMRMELYGCYNMDSKRGTTFMSTGEALQSNIGYHVSIESTGKIKARAVRSTGIADIISANVVPLATWTLITYWTPLSSGATTLLENDTDANGTVTTFAGPHPASNVSTVVLGYGSQYLSEPIQLSDVLVWKSSVSVLASIKTAVSTLYDGPVIFNASFIPSASAPFVIENGWIPFEGCVASQSRGTGPCSGLTPNTGFLYMEASAPAAMGDTAVLESSYRVSAYKCFEFSYHMWGENIGRLNIYATDNTGTKELLWRYGGNRGNRWHVAKVPLSRSRAFKLIIEGMVGNGFQGDIAVNEFKFSKQICECTPPAASVTYATGFARSAIIGGMDQRYLMQKLKKAGAPTGFWLPCFKSSDNHNVEHFWDNCQNKGPTVTILRYEGFIIGAYSDRDWASKPASDDYLASSRAFIFSLDSSSTSSVYNVKFGKRDKAIKIDKSKGPAFGEGLVLNLPLDVTAKIGTDYGITVVASFDLTGQPSFTAEKVEVFFVGDHPCDKWCALDGWECNVWNTKCKCDGSDRLISNCLTGKPQAFLGVFDGEITGPVWYFDFDTFPEVKNRKMPKTVTIAGSAPPAVAHVQNGISRRAIKLDGTTNVDLGDYSGSCFFNDTTGGFTLSMWLKYGNKTGADSQTFVTFGNAIDGGARIQVVQHNITLEELGVLVNVNGRRVMYRFPCPWNIWSHIVVSWSSLDMVLVVYRNAQAVDITSYDICFGCNATSTNDHVYLGGSSAALAPTASMDEIGLWCSGLSSQIIQQMYQFFKGVSGFHIHVELEFSSKLWSQHNDLESATFTAFKTEITAKIKENIPTISESDVIFTCSGPINMVCNITIHVSVSDATAAVQLMEPEAFGSDVTMSLYFQSNVPRGKFLLYGHNTSETDISVFWIIPDEESTSGIYQSYNVLYHPQSDPSLLTNITEERYVTSLNLTNLTSYTPYRFVVRLHYLGGAYTTAKVIIWTGELAPDGPPLNVQGMTINATCVKLFWQNPAPPVRGLIRGFNTTCAKVADLTTSHINIAYPSNQSSYSYDVCGLLPATEYICNVSAFTIRQGPSATTKCRTAGEAPREPPANVTSLNGTAPNDLTSTCLVKWNFPPAGSFNGNLTSFRVISTNILDNTTVYSEIGVCNSSKLIKDLTHYSVYRVTVSGANANGHGPYSTPVFCYTEGTVPSAPPTNVQALGNNGTSIRVTWGPVAKEHRNGLILGYNVTYFKYGEPESNEQFVIAYGEMANTTDITGLKPFTKYNISIAAFTKMGTGNESSFAAILGITQESAPEAVPGELTVTGKSNTSCSLKWIEIPDDKANGILRGYEIIVITMNTSNPDGTVVGYQMTCASSVTTTLNKLLPFHLYNITASGFNSMAISNKSLPLLCMTDEEAPLIPPPNLVCQTKTSRIIEVCWQEIPIELRQGIVRNYIISNEIVNQTYNTTTTPPVLCFNLTDLEEFTTYAIKVKAVTVKEGNFSDTAVQCTTNEGVPRTAPQNMTGRNLSAYSILVCWDGLHVDPPGILRTFVIFYRIANASEDTTVNVTVDAKFKCQTLVSLRLFTLYCFQMAGFTVGVGPRSDCFNISTDDKLLPPPDGIPSNLTEADESTERNCSIKWSKTGNSNPDPDGRVIGYKVYYRLAGTNDTELIVEVKSVNSTSCMLEKLEEFTEYEIRVAAFNIYGAGNKSDVMLCYTKEDAPSLPPPNVTAQNTSSTTVAINWFDIIVLDRNGIIREYRIIIFEVGLGNSSAIVVVYYTYNTARRNRRAIGFDQNTKTITGLKKFTQYAIQVYGVTISDGPLSPVIYVTTAEDVPTATVTNLTIANSSSTSILLLWSNVPDMYRHGIIRYFVIYYWRTDWPLVEEKNITVETDKVRNPSTLASHEFKFNMTNLKIWTNYTIQVAAFTVGVGVRTNTTTVSTDEDIPCLPPDYITFDIPAYSSLLVRWTEVLRHCRNGIIRGYRLIYQELVSGSFPVMVNFTASDHYYIIENMNMEANYTVQILAFTKKGDGNATFDLAEPDKMGPRSTPINVTTENFTTPTTLPVNWKPIQEPVIREKLLGYRVSWRVLAEGEEAIEDAPWHNYTVRKDTLYTVITGLMNYVHYQVHIAGFTRGGDGPSGIAFGDTCRCYKRVTTNYRIFSPYTSVSISKDLKSINMSGMIPEILNNLTVECCQTCKAHGESYVDFFQNGKNTSAFQLSEMKVKELIDDTNDLSFPVYGWKWQKRYQEIYRYIPLVESAGFAFILLNPETDSPLIAVLKSIIATWPYILITLLMALLAGIIVWFLDTAYNPEQFPHSFFKGVGNGWWWAFISMTTLGYGDKCPKANHTKAFAVVWVLTGLVVYGILSSSITTAFTTIIYQSSTKLYGSKVATIQDTPEYIFAVRRNAKVNTEANYSIFDEVLEALVDGKVSGMLMDAYEAGTKNKKFKSKGGDKIRIHKVYDYSTTFGVVIAGPSKRLYQCSRNWMSGHRAEMSAHIAKYLQVVEADAVNELVELTTGLFDKNSAVFKSFLKFSLIALGFFLILGVIWEAFYQLSKRKKNKLAANSPAISQMTELKKELGESTMDLLQDLESKIINLREKHTAELGSFLRQNRNKLKKTYPKLKGNLLPLGALVKDGKFTPLR